MAANRYVALHKELYASDCFKVINRLVIFKQSLKLFLANFSELEAAINCHVNAPLSDIRDMQARRKAQEEMFEVLRHLHNSVAAAISLVDHTRNFYNWFYRDALLIPEYQEQINFRFTGHGLSEFVKCLRQFCQHYRIPLVGSTVSFDNEHGGYTRTVDLHKADLDKFSGWSSPAKSYIEALPETIDLLSVMRSYRDHVVNFYEWFNHRLSDVHAADLANYDRIMTEIEHIQAEDPLYRDYQP